MVGPVSTITFPWLLQMLSRPEFSRIRLRRMHNMHTAVLGLDSELCSTRITRGFLKTTHAKN
jgi:hypothetical protein